jgi:hypothetical protein
MGQTADQVKEHIDHTRGRIGQDLNELEYRMHRSLDWRAQLQAHSRLVLGAAFALGFLIALVTVERVRP